jgi:ATP-dependent Clp protease ATP-binding subunit ClpC
LTSYPSNVGAPQADVPKMLCANAGTFRVGGYLEFPFTLLDIDLLIHPWPAVEKALRVHFFARYDASKLGSTEIEPEHLLLAILREDKGLAYHFLGSFEEAQEIRKEIEERIVGKRVTGSVELQMSATYKEVWVLAIGCKRGQTPPPTSGARTSPGGPASAKGMLANEILSRHGVTIASVREAIEHSS